MTERFEVVCFCDDSTFRGLRWALEQESTVSLPLELTLGDLFANEGYTSASAFFLALDLGQPVPLKHLEKFQGRFGICALQQPTPQQLLNLGQIAGWRPFQWHGSEYDDAISAINKLLISVEDDIKKQRFIQICQAWYKQNKDVPGIIELLNPPDNWRHPRHLLLDRSRGLLSIGQKDSGADLLLPINGNKEMGQLVYLNEQWIYRDAQRGRTVPTLSIKPGLRFEVEDFVLAVKMNSKVQEFISLAASCGIVSSDQIFEKQIETLEACLDILMSLRTGELQIRAEMKSGSIFFENGLIRSAHTGATQGIKALFRIMAWNNPSIKFEHESRTPRELPQISLNVSELLRLHQDWQNKWKIAAKLMPPSNLKISIKPEKLHACHNLSINDFMVLYSINQYQSVREILNYTNIQDVDILLSLIHLRKNDYILPIKRTSS